MQPTYAALFVLCQLLTCRTQQLVFDCFSSARFHFPVSSCREEKRYRVTQMIKIDVLVGLGLRRALLKLRPLKPLA
ncbi:hypothetical protein CPC08DRAFT_364809 [Agrocybe pediades]|nr:hypothetical protein CPC08DRAFT_364809 [Agrocybe pediades]